MKMKKVLALVLAGLMTASLAACGDDTNAPASTGGDTSAENTNEVSDAGEDAGNEDNQGNDGEAEDTLSGELTVWTLTEDLQSMAEHFMELHPNVKITTDITTQADYPTKIETALLGGDDSIDVFVGEPQMLESMYEADFFANLDEMGAQDYAGQIVDYVWEVGKDADGVQRAISYQITPAGFYYRMDIAQEVFGTDDPDEIGKLFADYDSILEAGKTLKEAGYRIFASDGETNYFSGDSAWGAS